MEDQILVITPQGVILKRPQRPWSERPEGGWGRPRYRRGLEGSWGSALRHDPCCWCGERCLRQCGELEPGGTVDHLDPLDLGGSWNWMNTSGSCYLCNEKRMHTPLLHYMLRLRAEAAGEWEPRRSEPPPLADAQLVLSKREVLLRGVHLYNQDRLTAGGRARFRGKALRWANVLRRDPCCWCGKTPPESMGTVEHLNPLGREGDREWENLVGACASCNQARDQLEPLHFLLALKREPAARALC